MANCGSGLPAEWPFRSQNAIEASDSSLPGGLWVKRLITHALCSLAYSDIAWSKLFLIFTMKCLYWVFFANKTPYSVLIDNSIISKKLTRRTNPAMHQSRKSHNAPVAQIPQCTSHPSHNAPFIAEICTYLHISVTKLCIVGMCTHVHISVSKWCIVGYFSSALWVCAMDLLSWLCMIMRPIKAAGYSATLSKVIVQPAVGISRTPEARWDIVW